MRPSSTPPRRRLTAPQTSWRRPPRLLDKVLIIDNTPATYEANYGNAVRVCDYTGDLTDDELPRLSGFLHTLGPLESVRKIEKRSWR